MPKNNKIWYASYGSNLLEQRFLCYIEGGKPKGATQNYKGCQNKKKPIKNKEISIKHALYFAKSAKTWSGGGVGFIKPHPDACEKTLGRMYLIEHDQFIELVKQETHFYGKLDINFEAIEKKGSLTIKKDLWYGQMIFLGTEEGHPIFTFTHPYFLQDEIKAPNKHYLKIIIEGLKETYQLSEQEIYKYLNLKPGIKDFEGHYSLKQLISAKF